MLNSIFALLIVLLLLLLLYLLLRNQINANNNLGVWLRKARDHQPLTSMNFNAKSGLASSLAPLNFRKNQGAKLFLETQLTPNCKILGVELHNPWGAGEKSCRAGKNFSVQTAVHRYIILVAGENCEIIDKNIDYIE
jgi:hypothetical protein